jgi:hypothetical protein
MGQGHRISVPLLLLLIAATTAAKGRTICTITLNSNNEKKVFAKHLTPQGFKIKELTPGTKPVPPENEDAGSPDEQTEAENWFR